MKSKLKIAVIGAKGLPPQQGGIERHCAEIYPRMVAQGHAVDLFARSSYTQMSGWSRHEFEGVQVTSLPSTKASGSDVIISSALGSMLTAGNYDIVHFHALGPSLFSWLPRIISPAKVVVTCHGLDWQRAKWGKFAKLSILMGEKAAVSCAHEVVVVSEALRSYFLKTYDRASTYIPNAPSAYSPSDPSFAWGTSLGLEPERYLVFLGRLVPEKCPDLLIQAFQALQPPDWKLVLVGGDDVPDFKAQLLTLADNNPNILFTGQLLGSQLAEIVRGAGACVLPSNLEGLPIAMMEAMAEGVPVVASNIPPHQQLLGQDRGVLFQQGDLDSCIQKLAWAIDHPQELKTLAKRAKNYVRASYNWDQITTRSLDLYHTVLERPTPTQELEPTYLTYRKSARFAKGATSIKYIEPDVGSNEAGTRTFEPEAAVHPAQTDASAL